jgi:cytoskeletal protein CcmA (bactofilin family)
MFTKNPEREGGDPIQRTAERASGGEGNSSFSDRISTYAKSATKSVPSMLGEDLTITGNIVSKGEIQVDGEIQGDIQCSSLLLGDKSKVVGGVVAEDVVVRGRVVGSLRALRVTLQAQSHVEGDIFHQSLAIEQGAYFEGKSRRSDDPLSGKAIAGNEGAKPQGGDKSDRSERLGERIGEKSAEEASKSPAARAAE